MLIFSECYKSKGLASPTNFFKLAVIISCAILSFTAQASNTQTRNQNILFQLGLDVGGDELAKVTYTDGDTQTIDAGGLISLAIGTTFQTSPLSHPELETQLSIGLKFDVSAADNGDLSWDRYPIEILQFYTTPSWRFGGGLTYHLSPELSGTGYAAAIQADFDNALGIVLETDYLSGGRHFIGARVTIIDYELNSTSFSGNSVGAVLGLRY